MIRARINGEVCELVRKNQLFFAGVVHESDARNAVREAQSSLEGLGEAQANVVLDLESVDDGIDAVLLPEVQGRGLVELVHLAVDPCADKPLCHQEEAVQLFDLHAA